MRDHLLTTETPECFHIIISQKIVVSNAIKINFAPFKTNNSNGFDQS